MNWKQSGYLFECSILRIVSLSDTHLARKSFEKIEEEWGPEEVDAHKVPQQFTTQKDVLQYAQQVYNIATDFLAKQLELAASQCEEAAENGKNDKKRANTCGHDAEGIAKGFRVREWGGEREERTYEKMQPNRRADDNKVVRGMG